jgi:N-dimethylarginine dimethylaminohydrolase
MSLAAEQSLATSPAALSPALRNWRPRNYVMCPPTHFTVSYCINPWMDPDQPVDAERALRQWQDLHEMLSALGHRITLVDAHSELPDMVFAANGGILIGDRALVPRFRFAERAGESECFRAAFEALGFAHIRQAAYLNEGEGDFRVVGDRILAGIGPRSEPRAADEAADFFELPVVPLTLVDPRLYHLDTALAVLDDDTVLYWPDAFDAASCDLLADLYPDAVIADESDAVALALNLVSDGRTVMLAPGHDELTARIRERGFEVVALPTDELRKAGGGAKCCVLEWHGR